MVPASIRFKNPGAMWGNALAIKWGASKQAVVLHDGKGQGNNIAVFPTFLQGICAQLDLWRSSANYKNKRFSTAIATWSGHNSVQSYINFCKARVPGLTEDTVMNDAFWSGPMGVPFLKAQAWHEAGQPYPAPDADWIAAQKRVMSGVVPTANTVKKAGGSIVTGTAGGVTAAVQSGFSLPVAIAIGLGIALVVFAVWYYKKRNAEQEVPHPALVAPAPE